MQERIRQKLEQRLRGFEYRQRARREHRAARQKAYRIASMMREQGTLRGARKYLDFKGIPYQQNSNPATGITTLSPMFVPCSSAVVLSIMVSA